MRFPDIFIIKADEDVMAVLGFMLENFEATKLLDITRGR